MSSKVNQVIFVLLLINLILDIQLLFAAYILYILVIPFHVLAALAIWLEIKGEYHTGKYILFMTIAFVFQLLSFAMH